MNYNEIKEKLGTDTSCSECKSNETSIFRIFNVKGRHDEDYPIQCYKYMCSTCQGRYRKNNEVNINEKQFKAIHNWFDWEYIKPEPMMKNKTKKNKSKTIFIKKVKGLTLVEHTENRNKKYLSKEWLQTREAVFKRDNYECVKCKSTEDLRCHHKLYVSKYPIWAYDLCVFETLCEKCHSKLHKKIKGSQLVVSKEEYFKYVLNNGQGSLPINNRQIKNN